MKKRDALYCLDWDIIDFSLYGTWTSGDDYQALDINILPCGLHITLFDGSVDKGNEDCNWDKEAWLD